MNTRIDYSKLNKICYFLPRSAKVRYLPLTRQILIYDDQSNIFNESTVKAIGAEFGEYEIGSINTRRWSSSHFVLINHFCDEADSEKESREAVALETYEGILAIPGKVLVEYAISKVKSKKESTLSWEFHTASAEGSKECANQLYRALNNVNRQEIFDGQLIDEIAALKKCSRDEQRFLIYSELKVLQDLFDLKNCITPGTVEFLLNNLTFINEKTLPFDCFRRMNITYPKDIEVPILRKQNNVNPANAKINGLNIPVYEFNLVFGDKYSLGPINRKELGSRFWPIVNGDGGLCGIFYLDEEKNEFNETDYSKRVYHFIGSFDHNLDVAAQLSSNSTASAAAAASSTTTATSVSESVSLPRFSSEKPEGSGLAVTMTTSILARESAAQNGRNSELVRQRSDLYRSNLSGVNHATENQECSDTGPSLNDCCALKNRRV